MLDWLVSLLKLKILFHWLIIYIIVNILEYLVIHLVLKWFFHKDKPKESPNGSET